MRSQEPQLAAHRFQADDKRETIQTPSASEIHQRKPITLPSSLCKPSLRAYFDWDDRGNDDYTKRPALLDLFAGGGGAAMGYYLAGFRVVGIDLHQQKHYPFEFHQADAMTYPLDGFDVIHASPPCQAYCALRHLMPEKKYPDLVASTRELLIWAGTPYVIENVPKAPLLSPVTLCGSYFNLRVRRHRLFESNVKLQGVSCFHKLQGHPIDVSGTGGRRVNRRENDHGGNTNKPRTLNEGQAAMGINWMTRKELSQAIPPAYTEFIGRQLIVFLGG